MSHWGHALRRVFAPSLVTLGLLLMHGGIGQAVACTGMPDSSAVMPTGMTSALSMGIASSTPGVATDVAALHAVHHQVANDPVGGHHSEMCVSTPTKSSGGGPNAAPPQLSVALPPQFVAPQRPATVTRATGREPPAPDLISVFCVIRR